MQTKLIIYLLVISLTPLFGCGTFSSALIAKGSGQERTYQAPFDKVWPEMPTVIRAVGLTFIRSDTEEHYLLAERGHTGWSWGEKVAIFVTPVGQQTTVEVVAKRVNALNITSAYWTWADVIFNELDKRWK